jgi:HlyD family secretion protein
MLRSFTTAFASLACLCAEAAELIVEPGPFSITHTLTGTILPEKNTIALPSLPQKCSEWTIQSIMPHGSRVAKGDVIIAFDPDMLKKKIEDTKHVINVQSLGLARAEQELTLLTSSSEHKIEALRTAARIAKEEYQYFLNTRKNTEEKSADQSLERAKQYLANQEEELRQLKKMYDADDLTEETEEIILTRQKNAVTAATFALELETLRHKRTREVLLPREGVTLQNQSRDTSMALDDGTKSIPLLIRQKSSELDGLKNDLRRENDNLADLEKDLALLKILAPQDGWFFHGVIESGRWNTGETAKSLAPGGSPSLTRPFATFIPAQTPLVLYCHADDAIARALSSGQSGQVVLPGREDIDITASIASVSPTPSTDGKHTLLLRPNWPKEFAPSIGTTATIRLVSYHKDNALSIPLKALHFSNVGFTVSVKLADGKTERRPVRRGRISGEYVEILQGLDKGQVVVVPES